MSHQEPELVKVLFRYHSKVLDEETVETMWAKTIDSNKGIYQLDSIPFYGPIIAPNDTFIAKYLDNEQMLTFQEIIEYIGVCLSFFSVLVVIGLSVVRRKFKDPKAFRLPFGNIIAFLFVVVNLWMIYHLVSNDINMLIYALWTIILGELFYLYVNYV